MIFAGWNISKKITLLLQLSQILYISMLFFIFTILSDIIYFKIWNLTTPSSAPLSFTLSWVATCRAYAICNVNDAKSFAFGGNLDKGVIHNYNGMPTLYNRTKELRSYGDKHIILMTQMTGTNFLAIANKNTTGTSIYIYDYASC